MTGTAVAVSVCACVRTAKAPALPLYTLIIKYYGISPRIGHSRTNPEITGRTQILE